MLTRMFALITLASYLLLGSITFRVLYPESREFSFDANYFKPLVDVELSQVEIGIEAPKMEFAEIVLPAPVKKINRTLAAKNKVQRAPAIIEEIVTVETPVVVHEAELPFGEPVKLEAVAYQEELETNLVASYTDFVFETATAVAEVDKQVVDEVTTVAASDEEVEPEFFEYKAEDSKVTAVTQPVLDETVSPEPTKATQQVVASVSDEVQIEDLVAFDYSTEQAKEKDLTATAPTVASSQLQTVYDATPSPVNPFAFDYSKATKSSPRVTTQQSKPAQSNVGQGKGMQSESITAKSDFVPKKFKVKRYPMSLTVQAIGATLTSTEAINSFEIRYKDDESSSLTDYGTGEIKLLDTLAHIKMTRAISLLKRGFTPTSTDVILEEGERNVTIPMLDEIKFNQLQEEFEGKTPIGALLIELDDDTELAQIDVPFGKVLTLNGDLEEMDGDNFRYQLFVGVRAGNALITFKQRNGEQTTKIAHVLENELTFDANYYEVLANEKVQIYEDDLLSQEASPLIVSEEKILVFGTGKHASKNDSNTYKLDFGPTHLGGRRYLELNHAEEPIFVGIRDNNVVKVPSENFIRHTLSRFEDAKLGSRCLIQVNLKEEAVRVDVGTESVASTLSAYTQMLDSDGKFYDSLSAKTKKVIIVGDSAAPEGVSADARINIRIENTDGSVQYLNSYCSPNTYLVEQL